MAWRNGREARVQRRRVESILGREV
jgi:hypothetical protein